MRVTSASESLYRTIQDQKLKNIAEWVFSCSLDRFCTNTNELESDEQVDFSFVFREKLHNQKKHYIGFKEGEK